MTKVPQPTSWSAHFVLKYDAWNRMVEVRDGSNNLVQQNEFDGLGRRIVRSPASGADRHYYYNEQWQLVEERLLVAGELSHLHQFLWHPYYIDALAVRYDDDNTDESGITDYYSLHDANYNVTAVALNNGNVVERYAYSPYGEVTVLDADFAADTDNQTDIANTHFYTGRERDPATGLQLNRHRYYSNLLGRWLTRDPIGFEGSQWNLYEYTSGKPVSSLDAMGLGVFPIIHGNYCGGGGTGIPKDDLDVCCYQHDKCYQKCGGPQGLPGSICPSRCRRRCDAELCGCASVADCKGSWKCNLAKVGVVAYACHGGAHVF